MRNRKLGATEAACWDRRGAVLDAVNTQLAKRPDRDDWDEKDWRRFRYALAISRRMEKLN
jgi:hypothetical protein